MSTVGVLVVDDDGEICDLYSSILQSVGLPVRCVTTRAEAVAANDRPACVILDWELPDGSGLDVALALHRRWGRDLPIILVTGASLRSEDVTAAGVTDWLSKPFEMDEVVRTVRAVVDHARANQRPI